MCMNDRLERPIMVWSVPRSISTAFERAFMQRNDTAEVLHEPFGESYYYGPGRMSKRYSLAQCAASDGKDHTYADIHKLIMHMQEKSNGKLIVAKEIAQYVVRPEVISAASKDNPTVFSGESNFNFDSCGFDDSCIDADLKKFRHTFLMRDPRKSIASFYRVTLGECGIFGEFDPNEAGFAELQALMEYTQRLLPDDPLVLLDSADLIAEPEKALRAFCSGIGIPFERSMLSWEKKHISQFAKWTGWHEQAQYSTGFTPVARGELELPQHVTDAISRNIPIYESLQQLKLQI